MSAVRPAPLLVKIDRRRSAARSRRAEPQTSPPHATRLRALGRRHSLSTVAPPRRAARARHRYREPHGFVPPVLDGDAAARPPPARSQQSGYTLGPLRTRSVGLEPRAVRFGRVALRQKARPVDARHPHEGPKNPPGRCDFALLRPLKNPLRGSRPTWAVWAPRRRRPPDRSALLRFFDSQSNMGLPRHQRRPAPPPSPSAARGRRWVLTPPWRTRCTSSGVDWGPNFITRTAAFRPARTRARDDARRRRSRRTRRVASPTTSRSSGTSPVPPSAKCEVSSLACLRGVSAASCRPCWSHQRCGARKGRLIRGPGGERFRS